jgi:hypothetical protein
MGFDLWNILGVSPQTGLVAAVGTLVLAGLMGIRLFLRNRSASRETTGLSLDD